MGELKLLDIARIMICKKHDSYVGLNKRFILFQGKRHPKK